MRAHARPAPAFALPPVACAARPTTGVPSSAAAAAPQIKSAVRTALASGKRRLCVDLLLGALDPRARTYDDAAAATVFSALVRSMQGVLPAETPLRAVVAGPHAALRARDWVEEAGLRHVSVDLLGMRRSSAAGPDADAALLLLCPPAGPARVADVRAELAAAHEAGVPAVVHNHPRDDAVFESLGFRGTVSRELWTHDTAYLVAPFAVQADAAARLGAGRGAGGGAAQAAPGAPARFVLMRQMPGKWQLWRLVGAAAEPGAGGPQEQAGLDVAGCEYVLCREYDSRPGDKTLFEAIRSSLQ